MQTKIKRHEAQPRAYESLPHTWFWYDKVGRLVASRNSQQKLNNAYSYSLYDALSRVIQTGMTRNATALTDALSLDSAGFLSWVAGGTKTEITSTYYDIASLSTPNLTQQNLRGRVASTSYEDSYDNDSLTYLTASHYTYDIAGNVY